jgi:hypothetical protein
MPDIDYNVTVDITGNTAAIATDYVTSGVTNAHVQIVKLAYGSPTTATRVTTSAPLPVDIRTVTATVGVTGSVYGLGNFRILNGLSGTTLTVPLVVSGTTASGYTPVQINGYVQGITSGVPVAVTGSVYLQDGGRIQGITSGVPVAVTGGRYLSSSNDSVTVSGTVGITGGRYLLQSTDAVRIFAGNAGETMIPVTLRSGAGDAIGSSGGALNVNIVGAGITATVSVGAIVGISQADQTVPLFVAGATAGPAVRVKGSLGAANAVEVGWSTAQNVAVTSTVENNDGLITAVETLQNDYVDTIVTNTNNITSIYNTMTGSGVNAQIVGFTRPGSVYTGNSTIGVTASNLGAQQLKTGITLKAVGGDIRVKGASSPSAYLLSSGEILFIETNNLNTVSFTTASGTATLYYIAT